MSAKTFTVREYIVVTNKDSKVVLSGSYVECKRFANAVRRCGGEVTVFRATKG